MGCISHINDHTVSTYKHFWKVDWKPVWNLSLWITELDFGTSVNCSKESKYIKIYTAWLLGNSYSENTDMKIILVNIIIQWQGCSLVVTDAVWRARSGSYLFGNNMHWTSRMRTSKKKICVWTWVLTSASTSMPTSAIRAGSLQYFTITE